MIEEIKRISIYLENIEIEFYLIKQQLKSKEEVIELQRKQIKGLEEGIKEYENQIKLLKNNYYE